jgi:nucleoside-diphosphate-sugar epimerase
MSSENPTIVILGGHGKIARLTAPKLVEAGYNVEAVIRNPQHREDIDDDGIHARVVDIEQASQHELEQLFEQAAGVLFAAGAGGGNPERTHAVDYEAAKRAMDAAVAVDVARFVLISYSRALVDIERIDPENSFYPYAKAKHDADAYLRETDLDYTILGPGMLTEEPATGRIQLADKNGDIAGLPDKKKHTSRDNVARVVTYAFQHGAGVRQTVNFYDGDQPIDQVFPP